MATDGLRRLSVANLAMRNDEIPLPIGTKQAKKWREILPFPPFFQPFYASKFSRFIAWLNASSPLRERVQNSYALAIGFGLIATLLCVV